MKPSVYGCRSAAERYLKGGEKINIFGKKNTEQSISPVNSNPSGIKGATKHAHIVEMTDDEVGARNDVDLPPGVKVLDVKKQLGYTTKDSLIRAKNRQVLNNDTDLSAIAEPGEKFIIVPNTEVGVKSDIYPFFIFMGETP